MLMLERLQPNLGGQGGVGASCDAEVAFGGHRVQGVLDFPLPAAPHEAVGVSPLPPAHNGA